MRTRAQASVIWPILVGLAAGGLSLWRVYLANEAFLSTQVWAEDGLFPLCVRRDGIADCLLQPFAGYLLLLPRLLAAIVAVSPFDAWPLTTNLVAAILAAVCGGLAFVVLRNVGVRTAFAVVIALLPVAAPIVGFEAVNVYASGYMPLLFLVTLAVSLPGRHTHPWWIGIGLLVAAMTIPTTAVLVLPIILWCVRRRTAIREAFIMLVFLFAGLAMQAVVMLGAPERRNLEVTWDAIVAWVQSTPGAVLTVWPGIWFGPATAFDNFPLAPSPVTGWLIVGAWAVGSVWLMARASDQGVSIGLLMLVGLMVGAIPAVTGYASNRYFVVPVLLLIAAGMLALDARLARRPVWVPWILVALVAVLWWSALPASPFRGTTFPSWPDQVAALDAQCASDPGKVVAVRFSPDWPPVNADGSDAELARITCLKLR